MRCYEKAYYNVLLAPSNITPVSPQARLKIDPNTRAHNTNKLQHKRIMRSYVSMPILFIFTRSKPINKSTRRARLLCKHMQAHTSKAVLVLGNLFTVEIDFLLLLFLRNMIRFGGNGGVARNHISSPIQCAKLVKITINIQLNHIAVWIVIA